jgi:hypothetical protein
MILFFFFQKPPQYDQFIKERNILEEEIKRAESKLKSLNRNIKFIDAVFRPSRHPFLFHTFSLQQFTTREKSTKNGSKTVHTNKKPLTNQGFLL